MESDKTFGETVRKLREDRRLTLREVAEALEVDTSMLGKIEKNNRRPTKVLIRKFSRVFGVSEVELNIIFLSDAIAYKIIDEEDCASEVLRLAEKKVNYLKTKRNPYR